MAGTGVVWTDLVSCPSCSAMNDAREEWCELCLADFSEDRPNVMFVRRWSPRSRPR